MECGILGFGTRNAAQAQGIWNPTNDWNPESKFHSQPGDKDWNPVTEIRNPRRGIQNQKILGFPYMVREGYWYSSRGNA